MPIYDLNGQRPMIQGANPVGTFGGAAVASTDRNLPTGLGGQTQQQTQNATLAGQQKYRQEYGAGMTDAEYAQRKQSEQLQAAQQQQQPSQQSQSYSGAASAGLSAAAPSPASGGGSNYTGAPTSSLDADRAKMQLEAAFATQANDAAFAHQTQATQQGADLQAAGETRRLSYLPQIMGSLPPTVGYGSAMGGVNEEGARSAAFARAKEQAGGTALSALRALNEYSAGRGQTGSSMERGMAGNVVGGAAGQVNEFTRDQMIADLQRAAQISDQTYQGNIAQRGQNLSLTPSILGLIGSKAY